MKKPSRKTTIKKLDDLCRKACLIRDDSTCQWCGSKERLQLSHVRSRRFYETRWELANTKILCAGCHLKWHENPVEADNWFDSKFPARRSWILDLKQSGPRTWRDSDLKEIEQMLLQKIQELENE